MEALGNLLFIVGILILVFYNLVLLVKAFQVHILWGIGYILVPFVALVFIIMHWDIAKKPFLMSLISLPILILAAILSPESIAKLQ